MKSLLATALEEGQPPLWPYRYDRAQRDRPKQPYGRSPETRRDNAKLAHRFRKLK